MRYFAAFLQAPGAGWQFAGIVPQSEIGNYQYVVEVFLPTKYTA